MTDEAIVQLALEHGWTYDPTGLYEGMTGIQGFVWYSPYGREGPSSPARDGDWDNGPEIPVELRMLYDAEFRTNVQKSEKDPSRFYDMWDSILERFM